MMLQISLHILPCLLAPPRHPASAGKILLSLRRSPPPLNPISMSSPSSANVITYFFKCLHLLHLRFDIWHFDGVLAWGWGVFQEVFQSSFFSTFNFLVAIIILSTKLESFFKFSKTYELTLHTIQATCLIFDLDFQYDRPLPNQTCKKCR